jgi:hypothetical protein
MRGLLPFAKHAVSTGTTIPQLAIIDDRDATAPHISFWPYVTPFETNDVYHGDSRKMGPKDLSINLNSVSSPGAYLALVSVVAMMKVGRACY